MRAGGPEGFRIGLAVLTGALGCESCAFLIAMSGARNENEIVVPIMAFAFTGMVVGATKNYDMALGLAKHQTTGQYTLLENFAKRVGAKTYRDIYGTWGGFRDMEHLGERILGAMNGAKNLRFNLDGMSMSAYKSFLANPVIGNKNITNWELWKVSTTGLQDKTTFYGGMSP